MRYRNILSRQSIETLNIFVIRCNGTAFDQSLRSFDTLKLKPRLRHQKGATKLSLPLSLSFFHLNCDDKPASDTRHSLKPVRSLVPGSPSIRLKRFHSQNKTCNYRFESSVPPFETPSVSVRVVRCAHARLNSRYKEEDRSRALWSVASPLSSVFSGQQRRVACRESIRRVPGVVLFLSRTRSAETVTQERHSGHSSPGRTNWPPRRPHAPGDEKRVFPDE